MEFEIMDIIGKICDWAEPLFNLATALGYVFLGYGWKKISKYIRQRKLSKLLSLKSNVCEVIIPVRTGVLFFDNEQTTVKQFIKDFNEGNVQKLPLHMRTSFDYVSYDEAKILIEMQEILLGFKDRCDVKLINPLKGDMYYENNKFCYGSIKSNDYTRRIFSGEMTFKFKRKFLFGCTKESYYHPGSENLRSLKRIDDNGDGKIVFWENDDGGYNEYRYIDDYIVLIKISSKKFNNKNHGPVHLCFGEKANAPLIAAKCYNNHIDILYKLLKSKKHLNDYFVIMKCDSNGEIDFSENSFLDITDVMM